MASSRSPSPAVSARASDSSSPQLTPRSKLRKMLAAIDDSSDEESSGTTRLFRPAARPAKPISRSPTPQAADSSDSDDQDILRPRGRLAARMQTGEVSPKDSHTLSPIATRRTPEPETRAVEHPEDEDEEDDEVMARHPRRQKAAKPLTPTRQRATASTAASSPAMFVTPSKGKAATPEDGSPSGSGNEGDMPEDPTKSKRFKARLLELREKRVREAEERSRKEAEEKANNPSAADGFINDEDESITDDEGGHKLTQDAQGRPSARKASKKALEEMHRETQRLNRNLQLAHEAKTKMKVTKASLFERFNFKPAGAAATPETPVVAPPTSSRPSSPVSVHHTDAETNEDGTPPSSPPPIQKDEAGPKAEAAAQPAESTQAEASEITEVRFLKLDKGKGKATSADMEKEGPVVKRRQFRVTLPAVQANLVKIDDDDEELVVAKKSKLDALFDRVPARRQETDQSLHALRILAQIRGGSDGQDGVAAGRRGMKKSSDNTMSVGELQATLHRRAREQARLERDRRLEALRAKGVHVQTEEERERELKDIEDIVARARREAEEIMLREKEETDKERKESGVVDPLAWDDSDEGEDGDYQDAEEQEVAEIELSGSEDEDAEMEDGDGEEGQDDVAEGLVDEQADSADESADEQPEEDSADEDGGAPLTKPKSRRVKKQLTVVSDDEDEADNEDAAPTPKARDLEATPRPKANMFKSPSAREQKSPQVPTSILRSATKTFIPGLPVKMGDAAGLGLTQIFAGTMDNSQFNLTAGSPSQPMPTFEDLHGPNFSQSQQPQNDELILNSQPTKQDADDSQGVQLRFSQTQTHGLDSLMRDDVFATATQQSEWLEATQDEGFQHRSPLKRRFIEEREGTPLPMTAADPSQPEPVIQSSPLVRKGKLRRKAAAPEVDDDEPMGDAAEPAAPTAVDAFAALNKAAIKENRRKKQEEFDRKKSKAKEMFEEQAEESEDEYAGLGGADGEDSDDDGEDVKGMIDDNTRFSESDKAKIAALYADRERASDEKQVEKLFRDITTGMLRRKRGTDYDLSDDDDGGEARRRMKRRQFAKMQKALFADERVSKVAENPRTSAFMRTIEDRGSDDEDMGDLVIQPQARKPESSEEDSQDAADDAIPDSQPKQHQSMAPPPRLPGPQRRTVDGKKPSNLGEIRESLSNLLEDQKSMASMISATDLDSDSDGDDNAGETISNKENQNPRRSAAVAVVDRISLKRSGSSISESSAAGANGLRRTGSGSRTAFAMAGGASGSFKVPALLRRATSNSVASMASSTASSTGVTSGPAAAASGGGGGGGGFGEDAKIKKNASKRSGINYFARETERLAALAEKERRREAKKLKGAEGRSKVVGGLFSAGKFE